MKTIELTLADFKRVDTWETYCEQLGVPKDTHMLILSYDPTSVKVLMTR